MTLRYQKQKYKHDPDSGVYGDCHRTCVAIVIGVDRDEVPHFGENGIEGFKSKEREYYKDNEIVEIQMIYDGELDLMRVLKFVENMNPGQCFILGGMSRTGVNHSVVCQNGEIFCDPSIDDSGIIGPMSDGHYWVTFLLRKI